MDYLIDHFAEYANRYVTFLIEGYLLMVAVLFACWLRPFMERKRTAVIAAFVYFLLQTINSHAGTSKAWDRLIALGIILFSFLSAWLADHRRNPVQKIFLCVVFRLISWLSIEIFTEIGFFERDLLFRFDWYQSSVEAIVIEFFVWNFLQYTLALLLLYVAIRILQRAYRRKSEEMTWRELVVLLMPVWTLFFVKPIMSSYFLLWMEGMKNGSIQENIPGNPYRMLFSIFSYFPILIEITLYQKLKEKQEEEFVRRSLENQIQDTHRHVGQIEDLYEKMRVMRHDLGNHLMVIEGLAKNGNTEELAAYIGGLKEQSMELQPKVRSGNAVTDVVLSEISGRCEKEHILFESRFSYPEGLAINPFDMSVILTNALQNAFEASRAGFMEDSKNVEAPVSVRKISILSVVRERFFIINIKNKITQKVALNEEGLPDTTKPEAGHGYGLKNIRSIAQKYHGEIEIRQEEAEGALYFILNIMLMG